MTNIFIFPSLLLLIYENADAYHSYHKLWFISTENGLPLKLLPAFLPEYGILITIILPFEIFMIWAILFVKMNSKNINWTNSTTHEETFAGKDWKNHWFWIFCSS